MKVDPMLRPFDQRVSEVRRDFVMSARRAEVFDVATAMVDRTKVAELQAYLEENLSHLSNLPAFKYFDLPLYLANKSAVIEALDLDRVDPCRILDLGAGAGHFMFLAKCHGHDVLGLDMENDVYMRMLELYGLERLTQTIVSDTPLDLPGKFDLITSIQTTYNRPVGRAKVGRSSPFWTAAEWRWFFDQICGALTYPGRIFFDLNPQPDPVTGQNERGNVLALFEKNGAKIDTHRSTALFDLQRPLLLSA